MVSKENVRELLWTMMQKLMPNNNTLIILAVSVGVTLLTTIHYMIVMVLWTEPGLVFDDSYIHLQFARTIYEGTPWQYNQGELSTGSTSPLWSIALAPLFLISTDYEILVWLVLYAAFFYYTISTFLVGYLAYSYTESHIWSSLAMIGFVFLPANTMLMLSGMETPLFILLILLSIVLLDRRESKYDPLIGIVAGLVFLARPEGVIVAVVLVPARFLIILAKRELDRKRLISLTLMVGWMALIASFWVIYCLNATGHPLPATFYQKVGGVTEENVTIWHNFWGRWVQNYPYIALGFIGGVFMVIKGKPHPWLFAVALYILYLNTMPYQALINNARYVIPIFDMVMVCAVLSIALIVKEIVKHLPRVTNLEVRPYLPDITKFVAIGLVCMVMLVSFYPNYFKQADLFGREVLDTNDRQIILGLWLKENTPENAVIAIHDAGALRYFSERRIIDMAGLISPDIAFGNMTATKKLSYLREQGCDYFVYFNRIFNFWSIYLRGAYTELKTVRCPQSILKSNENMTVYWINWTLTDY